jgi:O-antigen/teichoic acid export membrane protein
VTATRGGRAEPLRLVVDFVLLSGGEATSKIIGFVAFAHLARVLAPEAYGTVEFTVSLALFFASFVDAGLGPIGAREVARDRAASVGLAAAIPSARLLIAAVVAPLMWGIGAWVEPEAAPLVALYAAALLLLPFNQRWLLQGLQQMAWVSGAQIVRMGVFALGVIVLVRTPDALVVVGRVEVVAALALAAYFVIVQTARATPFRLVFAPRRLVALVREGLPIGLGEIVWSLNQSLPTFLVASLVGGPAIGLFAAASRIVVSLASFSQLYHFNLFPAVSQALGRSVAEYERFVNVSYRLTAWAGSALGLAGSLLAAPVVTGVFGDAFAASTLPLAILIWSVPATIQSGHARWGLIAAGHQRVVLYAQLAGALTTAGVGLLAVPRWGASGAAATMLASQLAVWAVAHSVATRHVGRLPTLRALPPLLAAGVGAAAGRLLTPSPWLAFAVAAGVFLASMPVLDRRLVGEARGLLAAVRGARGRRAGARNGSGEG